MRSSHALQITQQPECAEVKCHCLTSSVIVFLCGQLLDFQLRANVLVHRELLMMTAYLHVGRGGNFLILKRVALSLQLSRPVDGGKKKQWSFEDFILGYKGCSCAFDCMMHRCYGQIMFCLCARVCLCEEPVC